MWRRSGPTSGKSKEEGQTITKKKPKNKKRERKATPEGGKEVTQEVAEVPLRRAVAQPPTAQKRVVENERRGSLSL